MIIGFGPELSVPDKYHVTKVSAGFVEKPTENGNAWTLKFNANINGSFHEGFMCIFAFVNNRDEAVEVQQAWLERLDLS